MGPTVLSQEPIPETDFSEGLSQGTWRASHCPSPSLISYTDSTPRTNRVRALSCVCL